MNRTAKLAVAIAAFIATTGAASASTFCAEARHADERTICNTPGMVRVDANMNRYYQKLMGELGTFGRWKLRARQNRWLAERRSCGRDVTCIRLAYRERVHTLRSIADRRGIDLD